MSTNANKPTQREEGREAQTASEKNSQKHLGESIRNKVAHNLTSPSPMPEEVEVPDGLLKLNKEKVSVWLEKNKDSLKDTLVTLFKLDPKYRMTDDELALFMDQLKDPAQIQWKEFSTLGNWLSRIRRENQKTEIDRDKVIERILEGIKNNESPEEIKLKKVA